MSIQATPDRLRSGQHTHRTNGLATDTCPYCGNPISRKEFERIAQIEADEKARLALMEKALAEKANAEIHAAKIKMSEIAEKQIQDRLAADREATEKRIAEAVNAERAKGFTERLKLSEQLDDLRRRLDRQDRPAGVLGEEGEADAFTLLSERFSAEGDEITRTKRFSRGADIEHRIVNGAGLLLYEVKNHQTYQTKWAVRAKENQHIAHADHVVIVSTAFPAGHHELMLSDDGVLVCSPSRLLTVAAWLRAHTIRSHALKLSNQDRADKAGRLYQFMTSDVANDRWSRMAQTVTRMRDALRSERTSHERAWADRATQIEIVQEIRDNFVQDLDAIFETVEAEIAS